MTSPFYMDSTFLALHAFSISTCDTCFLLRVMCHAVFIANCSSEVDCEDFEYIEHDEIIHSDCCSEANGKKMLSRM